MNKISVVVREIDVL